MTKYFKITNKNELHWGYQYKDGLNVLNGDFNDDPKQTCCAGRLYITDADHIHQFYRYGVWLREVTLPIDDPEFKMIKDPDTDTIKWGVNKLIFGKRHYLLDPDTIKLFNLPIDNYFIHKLSEIGDIETLSKWRSSGLELSYSKYAINEASANDRLEVLEWWKQSGLPLKYDSYAMDMATKKGFVRILNWWKNSGLPLAYDLYMLSWSHHHGSSTVTKWWKRSGLELK